MNEPNHHQIATYLIDYALSELVKYVMEDMPALQDEEGELYVQSPAYLYELMNQ